MFKYDSLSIDTQVTIHIEIILYDLLHFEFKTCTYLAGMRINLQLQSAVQTVLHQFLRTRLRLSGELLQHGETFKSRLQTEICAACGT